MVRLIKTQSICRGEKSCGDCQQYLTPLSGYNYNGTYVFSNEEYDLLKDTIINMIKDCPENKDGNVWLIERGDNE